MLVLTTETLPTNCRLLEAYGVLIYNAQIELSKKGIIRSMLERNRNEWEEALQELCRSAHAGANVIYGLQVSTAVGQFSNGTFLYVTMTGTAGRYETTD
jgi:hypothetical protein